METTRSLRKEHISSCFICGRINAGSLANFVQHLDNHREDVIRSISNKEWLSAKQEDFASQIRVRGAIEEIHIALEGDLNPSPVSNLGSKAGNPNEGEIEIGMPSKTGVWWGWVPWHPLAAVDRAAEKARGKVILMWSRM
eukprot:CAMPEP_0114488278 /NCGR_PEP_ID=MMETSP0109-20121206/1233_1 /TAXON_ID=29199 /ORGANISM="Chlorarachnion reptans, Strain CCCM449" /LENGTH=139 /DNA_ID=CAMNT_0001664637 /DNA_START=207 /DNA_END=624 /DNA_ORIENTATION=+